MSYSRPDSSDPAWKYSFWPKTNDKNCLECKLCGNRYNGGIRRMKVHLTGIGTDARKCGLATDDIQYEIIEYMKKKKRKGLEKDDDSLSSGASSKKLPRVGISVDANVVFSPAKLQCQTNVDDHNLEKIEERNIVIQHFAKWMYQAWVSFNAVKLRSFAQALEIVGRYGVGLSPPTYHEVRDICLRKEVENTKELFLLQQTSWRKYGCTIMLDDLGNVNGKRIIIFLANCRCGTFFLKSIDASCKIHDHDFLYSELDKVVEEVGEEHVVQVVSQNGEAYMKAGKLLMENRKCLIYAPCVSHSINLILTDFSEMPVTKSIIMDAREVTSFIYSHKLILAFIRKETGGKELVRAGLTQSISAFLTLQRLYTHKQSLKAWFV
ncbi:hypothetical protein RJ640_009204 [Escallonia rubra]|uniref:DUF659 domain-containing protein n=1 Tax=Escallonia rubra TaxID=112253 RepID=A0AA88U2K2_9ASTE|nr:hypothetical protein RJ640_009204 [Escallonia rubra]